MALKILELEKQISTQAQESSASIGVLLSKLEVSEREKKILQRELRETEQTVQELEVFRSRVDVLV
jgi:chaperonin cofactor prefoldin